MRWQDTVRGIWHGFVSWWNDFSFGVLFPNYEGVVVTGEGIEHVERRHLWWLLERSWKSLAVLGVSIVVLLNTSGRGLSNAAALVAVGAIGVFTVQALEWNLRRLVVTSNVAAGSGRLFEISGLISFDVSVMPLSKLTDLKFHQTAFGRLFGYGTIRVESAGQNQALSTIELVRLPLTFFVYISGGSVDPDD